MPDNSEDIKKTVAEWERTENVMIASDDEEKLASVITRSEFIELLKTEEIVGVSFADREQWLGHNGYEVTRTNMRDASLSSRPQQPKE